MSGPVSVVAVFNTVGEIKPLWINHEGEKHKIEKINSIMEIHGVIHYNCIVDGQMIVLGYDVASCQWSVG